MAALSFPDPAQIRSPRASALRGPAWLVVIVAVVLLMPSVRADPGSTPSRFTIEPATVRQRTADTSPVTATVVLKRPASEFFICEIRSADPDKLAFPTIIFKKGDLRGTSSGLVHWDQVPSDCTVKVSAFSVDAPDLQVAFTVSLKVTPED